MVEMFWKRRPQYPARQVYTVVDVETWFAELGPDLLRLALVQEVLSITLEEGEIRISYIFDDGTGPVNWLLRFAPGDYLLIEGMVYNLSPEDFAEQFEPAV